MSKIGNKEIKLPAGLSVNIGEGQITIKGPKGQLTSPVMPGIEASQDDGFLKFTRTDDSNQQKSYHGLCRSLANNSIVGVTEGFKKELEINGVGYRATVKGKEVELALGYSHPILFPIPEGITVTADKKGVQVVIEGIDKQQVGQVAANIRELRPPEVYKGKGIRYKGEYVQRKVGKAAGGK